jgi:hypothetical protein
MRKYRKRIHYTETDKALMWDRWRKGDSLEKIAQLFDRTHGSVAGADTFTIWCLVRTARIPIL